VDTGPLVLALSARSEGALRALAQCHAERLAGASNRFAADVCWNAATRRAALEQRAAFVAADAASMVATLRAYALGDSASAQGTLHEATRPRVAFVFPGQGAQWDGMAREMLATHEVFRLAMERCDAAARRWIDWSILEQLQTDPGSARYRLDQIDVIQPVLVALAFAYAQWLASLGIVPDAVVGHSMGEVGAACVAGILDLEQAMRIVCRRSALMRRTSGRGSMALVELSMTDTQARLQGRESQISVAASNSPRSSVISGEPAVVRHVLDELSRDGVFCRLVKVDVASHSPQMEPLSRELTAELADLTTHSARVPFHSTVLARKATGAELGAAYWGRNLRQPVLFSDALMGLLDDGVTVFVELSPHPLLSTAIVQTAQAASREVCALACGRRDEPDALAARAAVAQLWTAGISPRWSEVLPGPHPHASLPPYPWQRERHWVREAAPLEAHRRGPERGNVIDPEQQGWVHVLRWVPVQETVPLPAAPANAVLVVAGPPFDAGEHCRRSFDAHRATVVFARPSEFRAALTSGSDTVTDAVLLANEVEDVPFVAIEMLKALVAHEAATGHRVRLTIVTCGGQAVDAHTRRRVSVAHGALWGVGRVLAEEHPDLWGGLLDLDPDADAPTRASQLASEVCQRDAERQVAWRGSGRFGLRLQPLGGDADIAAPPPWPGDGAWLITGGLGAVALHLAQAMVAQGVRRLILLGRSPLPPRHQWNALAAESRDGQRVRAVRALEAAGAAVHLLVADVADPLDLERALRDYESDAWPPICGVLHAAGVLETGLATRTDRASFDRVYATKVVGAQTLDRLLPSVERFVMLSSISASLGSHGMVSYAAANAGLDALAQDRRARGLHGLSVQSGAWLDTGMFSGAAADANMQQLRDMGIQGFDVAQGAALFNALAGTPQPSITLLPVDWHAFRAARRGRDLRLFETLGLQKNETNDDAIADRLAQAASPLERRRLMEPIVREAIGRVLKLAPARIDPRKPLGAMGLNSLMAMELRNRLEAVLARPLSATLAWNYPTLETLAAFLCGDAPVAGTVRAAPPAASSAAPVLADVAELSDEDAAQLLRRKR
jgi:malonyl CoA-acyl carrier protein transacylase/NAD(P)-dependent dehydrogenase (short-subunit alcohol dehydrogenase family)